MRQLPRLKALATICICGSALVVGSAVSADEHSVQIGGRVAIACDAHMSGTVTPAGSGYKLGDVSQFCNTDYQVTLTHASAPSGATFGFRNATATAGDKQTVVNTSLPPTNSTAPIYVFGVTQTQAEALAQSLTLSVTPLGI